MESRNRISREEKWRNAFGRTAEVHGDQCVGLALGVRAMYLMVEMLGSWDDLEHATILAGTKRCLTEPFRILMGIPEERIRIAPNRDETLTVSYEDRSVKLHVTTRKFDDAEDVFSRNDRELFPDIEQTTRSNY